MAHQKMLCLWGACDRGFGRERLERADRRKGNLLRGRRRRPVGQAVKTPASHAGNAGSIPARVTTKKLFIMKGFFFLLLYYPRLRVNSIASLPVICSISISIQDRAFHSCLISFSTAVTSLLYFKPKTFAA